MKNNSKQIGGLLGPAIVAMILSEFPLHVGRASQAAA